MIILFILIITYACYSGQQWSFSPYDPSSNPYIVDFGENGLQYINSDIDGFIDTDSTTAYNKTLMLNRALTELESNGTTNGYIDTTSNTTTYNLKIYILIIFLFVICIGFIVLYGSYDVSSTQVEPQIKSINNSGDGDEISIDSDMPGIDY